MVCRYILFVLLLCLLFEVHLYSTTACYEKGVNTQGRQQLGAPTKVNSWEDCAKKCADKPGCTYWTWVKNHKSPYASNCALMSGFFNKVYDANTLSGSRACQGVCYEKGVNAQGRQQLGAPTKVNSWEDCAKKCADKPGCTYWTWVKNRKSPDALNCTLMSGFAAKVYDANTISGSRACQGVCYEKGVNAQGRQQLGAPTKVNSWEDCAKKCADKPDCTYWTWVKNRKSPDALNCALMSGFATKVYDANTISGSRECQGVEFLEV